MAQHPVDQIIGGLPAVLCRHDLLGQTAHILDQHDAQGDRHRPQLADRQGVNRLIGAHEAGKHGAVQQAVGMGNIGPCNAQHTRVARKGAGGQLGQLPVISWRQVARDLQQLALDHMIIVQQPVGRRCNGPARLQRAGRGAVGAQQNRGVITHPLAQRRYPQGTVGDGLGFGQRNRVVFKALGAEQVGADHRFIVPGVSRGCAPAAR